MENQFHSSVPPVTLPPLTFFEHITSMLLKETSPIPWYYTAYILLLYN